MGGITEEQRLTIGIVVTCLVLSAISFVLRLYARRVTAARFWYDDYWMFLVMTVSIAMSTSDFIGVAYSSGVHQTELSAETVLTFTKNLYVYMLLWACGVFSVKVGILLFYWRVFPTRNFRIAALSVGGFSTGIFLSNLFTFAFQCTPVSYFWDSTQPGGCIDQTDFYFASAIINVVGDVAVLSLPLPVVWNLHTSNTRKWSLSFLFLLGAFVCVASIFRIVAVKAIVPSDFTFSNVAGGIWSTVEVEVGFICANLPSLRPLVAKWFGIGGDGSGNNYSTPGSGAGGLSSTGGRKSNFGLSSRSGVRRDGHLMLSSKGGTTAGGKDGSDFTVHGNGSDEIELTKAGGATTESDDGPAGFASGAAPRFGAISVRTEVQMSSDPWDNESQVRNERSVNIVSPHSRI